MASESLECGRARFQKGEYDDAVRALESAVRPGSEREIAIEARYWLGESYYRLGRIEQADWLFRQVGQDLRQEFGPWALHSSGWTALRMDDAARARDAFTTLLARPVPVPLDVWGRFGLGLASYAARPSRGRPGGVRPDAAAHGVGRPSRATSSSGRPKRSDARAMLRVPPTSSSASWTAGRIRCLRRRSCGWRGGRWSPAATPTR